jgi:hypothetical protein
MPLCPNADFLAFFGENILKLITLVPGEPDGHPRRRHEAPRRPLRTARHRPGTDSIKLNFGRKVLGTIFYL